MGAVDAITLAIHTNLIVVTKVPIGEYGGITRILSNVDKLSVRVPE